MNNKLDLIKFVQVALMNQDMRGYLLSNYELTVSPKVTVGEVVAVLQMVCAAAAVACPIIDSLPSS